MIKLPWVIGGWKSHKLFPRKKLLSCFILNLANILRQGASILSKFLNLFTVYKPVTLHGKYPCKCSIPFWVMLSSWLCCCLMRRCSIGQAGKTHFLLLVLHLLPFCFPRCPSVMTKQWRKYTRVFHLPPDWSSLVCVSLFCTFLFISSLSFGEKKQSSPPFYFFFFFGGGRIFFFSASHLSMYFIRKYEQP